MKILLRFSLLFLIANCLRNVPKFEVDLNDMSTYAPVIKGKGDILRKHTSSLKKWLNDSPMKNIWQQTLHTYTAHSLVAKYGKLANTILYTSWLLNIPLADLELGLTFFEFACFAGIAEDDNGYLWLLRNFDWNKDEGLTELFAEIDFYEDGKLLYSGIQKIGFGMLMNATVKGEYTMAINRLFSGDFNLKPKKINKDSYLITMILGQVVQKAKTFREAVDLVTSLEWSSEILVIIAGKHSYEKVIIQLHGSNTKIKTTEGRWLSIGNKGIDKVDEKGESIREEIGKLRVFNYENLNELIQRRPLKTSITIYSAVTNVETGKTIALFADRK